MDHKGLKTVGAPSEEEVRQHARIPAETFLHRGAIPFIECIEEIPCNPCETACPHGAITVGVPITNLPQVHYDLCVGCGLCVAACPGQAIYLKNLVFSKTTATIAFPYEYYPLPAKNAEVTLVDRVGEAVCKGTVLSVKNPKVNDHTAVVTVEFPVCYFHQVVSMRRMQADTAR